MANRLRKGMAVLSLLLLAGAGPAAARTVTDLLGRQVTVPDAVERLVALGPGSLRLVVYLGAQQRVVGTEAMEQRLGDQLRPYAAALGERFAGLPVVAQGGPGVHPNPEQLIALQPQVVFVTTMDPRAVARLQRRTRLPVLALSYGELGVYRREALESLRLMGRVLGREQRAAAIVAYIEAMEADLRRRVADVRRAPSTYVGGIGLKGGHGIESTEAGYPPFALVRAHNIVAPEEGRPSRHLMIDRELLLARDPDHLFIDLNGLRLIGIDYRKRPDFYRALGAVRAGRVHALLAYNYYNTNIETVYANAYAVGHSLYPERFADVDPHRRAAAILRFFIGQNAYPGAGQGPRLGRVEFTDGQLTVR